MAVISHECFSANELDQIDSSHLTGQEGHREINPSKRKELKKAAEAGIIRGPGPQEHQMDIGHQVG